jgi:hypothetical protein
MTTTTDIIFEIDQIVAQLEEEYDVEDILDAISEYLAIADDVD